MSVQRGATVDALKAEIREVLQFPEADLEPPRLNGFVERLAAQGLEDLEALATLIHVSTTITGLTRTYNPEDIDNVGRFPGGCQDGVRTYCECRCRAGDCVCDRP